MGRCHRDNNRLLKTWLWQTFRDTGVRTTVVAAEAVARAVCKPRDH